jgi:hypothetical protein
MIHSHFYFILFIHQETDTCVQLHRDGGWGKGVYITQYKYKIKLQYNFFYIQKRQQNDMIAANIE